MEAGCRRNDPRFVHSFFMNSHPASRPGWRRGDLLGRLERDPNILFALVFGSRARGDEHPRSDLDLAVYFADPPDGLARLDLMSELSNLARVEVDLIMLNTASALLRHQVMKHPIRLFIRDWMAYRDFREKTIMDYDTYLWLSGAPS